MNQIVSKPNILGISAGDHDAAAAIFSGGDLVAAIEEGKLARERHTRGIPLEAIQYCLEAARLTPSQINYVAISRPIIEEADDRQSSESWAPQRLKQEFPSCKVVVLDHHLCHAASAFYVSPYDHATILTLDEKGDMKSGSVSQGSGISINPIEDSYFPDSLGNLYSRVARLVGYTASGDENKLQWLSTWGTPEYAALFRRIIRRPSGSLPSVDQSYLLLPRNDRGGFTEKFFLSAEIDPAKPLSESVRANLAASIQLVVEETVLELCAELAKNHKSENLCIAGGIGLNPLLISKIEASGLFKGVFTQPAAGNAGNALGAALYCAHGLLRLPRGEALDHLFYGPHYSEAEIKSVLENCKLTFRHLLTRDEIVKAGVEVLTRNRIVGWFQGRVEYGPRALGARSILASPLGPYVNENLNEYVKHREKFRPFAASVIEEQAGEYFEFGPMARFLATVGCVKPAYAKTFSSNVVSAPPSLDGSPSKSNESGRLRVHIVSRKTNPLFWELLNSFGKATGVPVLFNTSFNLFGEPLVCSPRDALRSYYCSGIDDLIIGNFLLSK